MNVRALYSVSGRTATDEQDSGAHTVTYTITPSFDFEDQFVNWTLASAGDPALNKHDLIPLIGSLDFVKVVHDANGYRASGLEHFANGDGTPKTIRFLISGDRQPERNEVVEFSLQIPNYPFDESVATTIKNDDGTRTYEGLVEGLGGLGRVHTNEEGSIPAKARAALQAERELFNVQEAPLLQAERYWYAVELWNGSGGVTNLTAIASLVGVKLHHLEALFGLGGGTRLYDLVRSAGLGLKEWFNISVGDLRSNHNVPGSLPSPEARAAFDEGVVAGFFGAWVRFTREPETGPDPWSAAATANFAAITEPDTSPVDLHAFASESHASVDPLPSMFIRSTASDPAFYVRPDGQAFATIWEPQVPVTDSDTIVFDTIDDALLQTGSGDDQIISVRARAHIKSGAGDDYIVVDDSGSTIDAGPGVDLVTGGNGIDNVDAGPGDDLLVLNGGADHGIGGDGADVLSGDAGDDVLEGGLGSDTLDGGADADQMSGGPGDDTYVVDSSGDVVTENPDEGSDTVQTTLATIVLAANVELESAPMARRTTVAGMR